MRINYLWEEHVHTGRRIVAFLKHHHLRPHINDDYKLLTQIENTRTHWAGKQKWLIEWVLGNLTKSEVVMVGITHILSTQWLPSGKVWKLLKSWFVEVELSPVIQVAHFDSTLLFWVKVGYSFFEHRTNSNMSIYWSSNSNTLFLALNDRTSNFKHCSTNH